MELCSTNGGVTDCIPVTQQSRNVQEPTLTMSRPYRDDFGILLDMEQRYYFTKTIFIETDAAAILKTALSLFGEELYKDISCDFLVVE